MPVQFTVARHRTASIIAILFVAATIFAMSNMTPKIISTAPAIEMSSHGHPLGTMDRKKIAMLAPTVLVLPRFDWLGQIDDQNAPMASIVPVLAIKDTSSVSRICDLSPNMVAIIKQVLRQSVATNGMLNPEILGDASQQAAQKINGRLGKVWVKGLYLLNDVTTPVRVASEGCHLINT